MMAAWDWNAIYLTCFGVGLVLSIAAFVTGVGHFHIGHFHFGTGGPVAGAWHLAVQRIHAGGVSVLVWRIGISAASLQPIRHADRAWSCSA